MSREERRGHSQATTKASPTLQDRWQTEGWLVFIWVEQDGSKDLWYRDTNTNFYMENTELFS